MSELSDEFKQFENELSRLVTESAQIKSKKDLKDILIRLNALQRIVYGEINRDNSVSHDVLAAL